MHFTEPHVLHSATSADMRHTHPTNTLACGQGPARGVELVVIDQQGLHEELHKLRVWILDHHIQKPISIYLQTYLVSLDMDCRGCDENEMGSNEARWNRTRQGGMGWHGMGCDGVGCGWVGWDEVR